MVYRTAIVGARRGLHHARAYQGLRNMKVIALCDKDRERLAAGVKELKVPGYKSYEEMLEKERPDIVHAVTKPSVPRAVWVEPAATFGVQVLVVEKPLALVPSEAEALARAQQKTSLKIIVNHQRRYMPFATKLLELIASGSLGQVHFVRASTQGVIMDMATHLMDVALLTLGDMPPTHVWATAQGSSTYADPDRRCPEDLMATYTFAGGTRLFFEASLETFGTADFPYPHPEIYHDQRSPFRCCIDIWANNGRFWWRENGTWGYQIDGMDHPSVEQMWFEKDDMPAQCAYTQAIATWLDDPDQPHLCRFEIAKLGFDYIMAAYHSALLGRRLTWPTPFTDAEWKQLRNKLVNAPRNSLPPELKALNNSN